MKSKVNKEAVDADFEEAKRRAQEMKHSLVEGATYYDKDKISERLYRMILYAIGRQDWYDDRIHRLLNIGLALVAASAALAAFVSGIIKHLPSLSIIFGLLTAFTFFCTGLALLYCYRRQLARNYPYREVVDIRSWYFIYNFPSKLRDSLSKSYDVAQRQIEETIEAYKVFLNRWLEYSPNQDYFIEEDLEQVFILQLLQRYRFQTIKTMSKILFYGILLSSILLIIAILSYVFS